MNQYDFDSLMLQQIRGSVEDIEKIAAAEDFSFFEGVVPADVLKKVHNVYLTGCGDSWCASIAAKPVFEKADTSEKTGMVPGTPTQAFRNIEFTRFFNTYKNWDPISEGNDLLCSVSISGSPARPAEAALRMNAVGGRSVAFTTKPESRLGQSSTYVVPMTLPRDGLCPNVTSYYASLFSLMMFGFTMNRAKGVLTAEQAEKCRKGLLDYVRSYDREVMERLGAQALELALAWEKDGVDDMDFIGDGPDWATAFFGSAKMVEACGMLTTNDDSEGWNHINFFLKDHDRIGTFFVANTDSPAFSRELETIKVASGIRKHLAVVTDGDPSLFPENAVVFRVPKAPALWMHPLMEHIPMDYVAAYYGCMRGTAPFRTDSPAHQRDPNRARFRESEIVIVK